MNTELVTYGVISWITGIGGSIRLGMAGITIGGGLGTVLIFLGIMS